VDDSLASITPGHNVVNGVFVFDAGSARHE
jgi:hypothetical protein